MTDRHLRAAVDVGGTFTDIALSDTRTGRLISAKVLTTPGNRADGVLGGIDVALDASGAKPEDVAEIVHGSTTGTNALIERTGAKVGLLTTEGFRDVLEIGRCMRPMEGLYDVTVDRPLPLVPRYLRLEARERLDAKGQVIQPLDERSVAAAAELFALEGVEAVAICFLFAFRNALHEERAAEIIAAALPNVPITLSHWISPEYREYERSSTAVMNAYLTPIMNNYLDDLEPRLQARLGPSRLSIIQANGGSTSVEIARTKALTTVNSGPAGGVVAAAFYGRRHGRKRIVSVDMGGTSFDIGLVEDGASTVTTDGAFQDLPVKIPIIDLHIIGAGGGSIAWQDPGGALNVGPRSAGSDPGPACYGRGGNAPTVTDANLVLGRLNPEYFNGGRIKLDADAARAAVGELAKALDMGLEDAALGILRVVNANMVKGIATVTIQRGIDVRDFSLLSFGGAGGLHAVDLAAELGMIEAVIPPLPGIFSAVGLLVTETRQDYVTALGNVESFTADLAELEAHFARMESKGAADMAAQGLGQDDIELRRAADLKIAGQTYELSLPLPDQGTLTPAGLAALIEAFSALYRERYAFFFEGEPIELVNLRVTAFGRNATVNLPEDKSPGGGSAGAIKDRRPVFFEGAGWVECAIYDRDRLAGGMTIAGPGIIEEETSATLVAPERSAKVTADHGLIIALGEEGSST
jgi:N-methylhydantoinase A